MTAPLCHVDGIPTYYPRWQLIIMLLAALCEAGYVMTKAEALEFIRRRKWFAIQQEDWIPYPSQQHGSNEPRWMTVLEWARKDCADRELMPKQPRNEWQATRDGHELYAGSTSGDAIFGHQTSSGILIRATPHHHKT